MVELNRWYIVLDNAPGSMPGNLVTPIRTDRLLGDPVFWYCYAPTYHTRCHLYIRISEVRPATDDEVENFWKRLNMEGATGE